MFSPKATLKDCHMAKPHGKDGVIKVYVWSTHSNTCVCVHDVKRQDEPFVSLQLERLAIDHVLPMRRFLVRKEKLGFFRLLASQLMPCLSPMRPGSVTCCRRGRFSPELCLTSQKPLSSKSSCLCVPGMQEPVATMNPNMRTSRAPCDSRGLTGQCHCTRSRRLCSTLMRLLTPSSRISWIWLLLLSLGRG